MDPISRQTSTRPEDRLRNRRDRQILCGLFLSKFDREGLAYLGFAGFNEAFNALGYGLQAKPASIKNYRDELDPHFPNARRGWHGRPLREHCQRVMDAFKEADIEQLGSLIRRFLLPPGVPECPPEIERILRHRDADESSSFARRLITGRAAEQYFRAKYSDMIDFAGHTLTDTTGWGCGFDFKLSQSSGASFRAVEVKGLRTRSGQIQLTELEHDIADALRERYYLVIIRNFSENPFHTIINNPTQSSIRFTKVRREEVRYAWAASIAG